VLADLLGHGQVALMSWLWVLCCTIALGLAAGGLWLMGCLLDA
jgi:hypothetical protein